MTDYVHMFGIRSESNKEFQIEISLDYLIVINYDICNQIEKLLWTYQLLEEESNFKSSSVKTKLENDLKKENFDHSEIESVLHFEETYSVAKVRSVADGKITNCKCCSSTKLDREDLELFFRINKDRINDFRC